MKSHAKRVKLVEVACRNIPYAVIGLFLIVLVSGVFVPVYSDEAVSKWSVSRFLLEDGHLVSFFPQCSTMSDRAVAWVFYPAALLVSTVYANLEPLGIRISGIILALIWFALLAYWCLKQTNDGASALRRFAGLIAFAALGVTPYLLILSRSEQFMTLPIIILCITSLYFKSQKSVAAQTAGAIFFILLTSCFFYVHPKSLFFLPFVIIALWLATQTYHMLIRLTLLAYSVVLFAQVLHESNAIAACTDAPAMQAILAVNTLLPGMLLSAPYEFARAALSNLANFPVRVLSHLTFNPISQSGWLPPIQVSSWALVLLNVVIKYLLYAFIVGTHVASLVAFLAQAARGRLRAPALLAGLLASANILNALFFNIQNFYSGTQFVPVAIILTMLLLQDRSVPKSNAISVASYSAISMLSVFSMVTLLSLVTPSAVQNSSYQKASLPGQPLSIPVFETRSHLESIEKLGASCGLSLANSESIVLDHMTYFAFIKDKKPIHVLYVSEFGYGGDLNNGRLLPFLRKLRSPGVITRCEWMPMEFRKAQKSDEMGYCCVNLNDL